MSQFTFNLPNITRKSIMKKLTSVYGSSANDIFEEIIKILDSFVKTSKSSYTDIRSVNTTNGKLSHKDSIFNTYADSIIADSGPPLQALYRFAKKYLIKSFFLNIIIF